MNHAKKLTLPALALLSVAGCGGGSGVASYPTARSLIQALDGAGVPCAQVSYVRADPQAGRGNIGECSAASAGDTAVSVFATHAAAVARARHLTSPAAEAAAESGAFATGPVTVAVIGNGILNTSSGYARSAARVLGGEVFPG